MHTTPAAAGQRSLKPPVVIRCTVVLYTRDRLFVELHARGPAEYKFGKKKFAHGGLPTSETEN